MNGFQFLNSCKNMFKPEDSDDTVYIINTSFYITANEIRKQLFFTNYYQCFAQNYYSLVHIVRKMISIIYFLMLNSKLFKKGL